MAVAQTQRPPPCGLVEFCIPLIQADLQMLGTILLVVLILMLLGALPTWGHSRSWGVLPSGGLGLVALIVVVLLFLGRI